MSIIVVLAVAAGAVEPAHTCQRTGNIPWWPLCILVWGRSVCIACLLSKDYSLSELLAFYAALSPPSRKHAISRRRMFVFGLSQEELVLAQSAIRVTRTLQSYCFLIRILCPCIYLPELCYVSLVRCRCACRKCARKLSRDDGKTIVYK